MKIALDIMGGDNAPKSIIEGALSYLKHTDSKLYLVGDYDALKLSKSIINRNDNKISFIEASDKITPEDRPSRVFKTKPESSLVKTINMVKDGTVDGAISAGNTGALLSTALFVLGKIKEIRRPALAVYIPSFKGNGTVLCDAGANTTSKPIHLVQFALMASAYMKHLENISNPKIGLLNIGSEKNKGNDFTKESYQLMEKNLNNFVGNVESRYIMDDNADILICDGFTGNILLKSIEGLIEHMVGWVKESIHDHKMTRLSAPLFMPVINDIKVLLDHEEHGATPLLGVNGVVMKAHGSSKSKGIKNALIATENAIKNRLIDNIELRLSQFKPIDSNE